MVWTARCRDGVMSCCWLWLFCAYPSFLVDRRLGCWPRRVSPSGLQRTGRRAELLGVKLGFPRSRCCAIVSDDVCALVGVHMHSCRRILFICTVQSLYYMRVYHRYFLTLACVCAGESEVGFVSACSWLALVTGVGGYVLAGVEIGVLSCIFLYFCGC